MALIAGNNTAKRITVYNYRSKVLLPAGFSHILIQNTGLNKVRLSFKSDSDANYFVLSQNDKTPPMTIQGGVTELHYKSEVSTSFIEILMWG